jgi:hypothetical protein
MTDVFLLFVFLVFRNLTGYSAKINNSIPSDILVDQLIKVYFFTGYKGSISSI